MSCRDSKPQATGMNALATSVVETLRAIIFQWLKLFCKTFWLRLNHCSIRLSKFDKIRHTHTNKTTIHKKSPFATSTLLYNTHKSGYRWLLCAASLPEPPNSIASPPPHGPCAAKAAPKTPIHFPVFLFSPPPPPPWHVVQTHFFLLCLNRTTY